VTLNKAKLVILNNKQQKWNQQTYYYNNKQTYIFNLCTKKKWKFTTFWNLLRYFLSWHISELVQLPALSLNIDGFSRTALRKRERVREKSLEMNGWNWSNTTWLVLPRGERFLINKLVLKCCSRGPPRHRMDLTNFDWFNCQLLP